MILRSAMLAVATVSAPALAQGGDRPAGTDNIALVVATAEAAVSCAVAARTTGVDLSDLDTTDWTVTDAPAGFRHSRQPVTISVVPAQGGQPESCVVEATLASQSDQRQLIAALGALLPGQPVEERGGQLWRFGLDGNGHSLHMMPDDTSPQPVIRFTGIGF